VWRSASVAHCGTWRAAAQLPLCPVTARCRRTNGSRRRTRDSRRGSRLPGSRLHGNQDVDDCRHYGVSLRTLYRYFGSKSDYSEQPVEESQIDFLHQLSERIHNSPLRDASYRSRRTRRYRNERGKSRNDAAGRNRRNGVAMPSWSGEPGAAHVGRRSARRNPRRASGRAVRRTAVGLGRGGKCAPRGNHHAYRRWVTTLAPELSSFIAAAVDTVLPAAHRHLQSPPAEISRSGPSSTKI